jgi:hypothetical protein
MTKAQKKALRFAYRLLRGDFKDNYWIYTHKGWIEPDCAPDKPYLDEQIFVSLVMRGYLECTSFRFRNVVYLYRITPEGCTAIGREWPLGATIPAKFNPRNDLNHTSRQLRHTRFPIRKHLPILNGHIVYHSTRPPGRSR